MSTNLVAPFIRFLSCMSINLRKLRCSQKVPLSASPTMDGIVNTTTRCRFLSVEDTWVIIALIRSKCFIFNFPRLIKRSILVPFFAKLHSRRSFDEILIWLWAQKIGLVDVSLHFFRHCGTFPWASLLIGYYIDFFVFLSLSLSLPSRTFCYDFFPPSSKLLLPIRSRRKIF